MLETAPSEVASRFLRNRSPSQPVSKPLETGQKSLRRKFLNSQGTVGRPRALGRARRPGRVVAAARPSRRSQLMVRERVSLGADACNRA